MSESFRSRRSAYWEAAVLARLRIWQVMPLAGWWRIALLGLISLVLGLLPLAFMLATSAMIGGVPEGEGRPAAPIRSEG